MSDQVVRVGAVAYDPKVVTIWEGFRDYFREAGVPTDYVLFSNYDSQVDALLARNIDVAWNTNVAYVRCESNSPGCLLLGTRNTDLEFTTRIVAPRGNGISELADLKGRRLALGSSDSAQASILPRFWLSEAGLRPDDVDIVNFDLDAGKHGDTGTSELEVLRALHEGAVDAGAIGHATWIAQLEQGRVNTALLESVWTSPSYSHCNFTALPDFDPELAARWTDALLRMDYNHPRWRRLMDLEGLTSWERGSRNGYEALTAALSHDD